MRVTFLVAVAVAAIIAFSTWRATSNGRPSNGLAAVRFPMAESSTATDRRPIMVEPTTEVRPRESGNVAEVTKGEPDNAQLFNTAETREMLKAQGASELDIQMMFIPAKLSRYREIIEHYRAMGDENSLVSTIQNTLCNAIAAELELLGGGMQDMYRQLEMRDLLNQGLEVFALNGKQYTFPANQFRVWQDFQSLRAGQGNDTVFAAQRFYDELDILLKEVSREALRFTGNKVLQYQTPWKPEPN